MAAKKSKKSAKKLGIIAGQGELPRMIVDKCLTEKRDVFVLGFKGQFDKKLYKDVESEISHLGSVQTSIDILKNHGVKEIVLAGAIKRPSIFALKLDKRGAKLIKDIGFKSIGDDSLLRVIMDEIESEGFKLTSTTDLLAEELTVLAGTLTKVQPSEQQLEDIKIGVKALQTMADLDIGQAVAVQQGLIIGVEAVEGTDGLIKRYSSLKKEGEKGVLIKILKTNQDTRVDLPTIGARTVQNAAKSGFAGIAISASTTQILDKTKTIAVADHLGLFIEAVDVT